MSLIEKALGKTDVIANGDDTQIYVSQSNHKEFDFKRKIREKFLLFALLPVLVLIIAGLMIYQKNSKPLEAAVQSKGELVAKSPVKKTNLDATITGKANDMSAVSQAGGKSKDLTEKEYPKIVVEKENYVESKRTLPSIYLEKESLYSLSEDKRVPELVEIENKIESHYAKPEQRNENSTFSKDKNLYEHYNNAVKLEKDGKFVEAVFEYERSIVLNPDHIKSYNNLGGLYNKLKRFDLAVGAYKKALAINPDYVKAHNNLGLVLFQLDKVNEAINEFKAAISMDSKNVESYNNLGLLYKYRGDIAKARKTFKSALSINPENAEVHYNLALLYESEGNLKQAFSHYQEFVVFCSPKHVELKKKINEHLFVLAKKSVLKDNK